MVCRAAGGFDALTVALLATTAPGAAVALGQALAHRQELRLTETRNNDWGVLTTKPWENTWEKLRGLFTDHLVF